MLSMQAFSVKIVPDNVTKIWITGTPGSSKQFDIGKSYPVVGTSLESGIYQFCVVNNQGQFRWIDFHHFLIDFESNETLRNWRKENKEILRLPKEHYDEYTDVENTPLPKDVTTETFSAKNPPESSSVESSSQEEEKSEASSSPAKKRGRPSKKGSEKASE